MANSFDLTCKKGYYPQIFNTAKNLVCVGPYPTPKYSGADYMSGNESAQFLNGTRSKKTTFYTIRKSYWPNAWTMSKS